MVGEGGGVSALAPAHVRARVRVRNLRHHGKTRQVRGGIPMTSSAPDSGISPRNPPGGAPIRVENANFHQEILNILKKKLYHIVGRPIGIP